MKHRILTLTLFLSAITFAAKANPVDMNIAREVALKFVNANTKTHLRSTDELQLATTYSISRGDAAFHIFNTPNGFVIVSADDCATPILGYSDEGRPFDMDNIPIQLQDYLQGFVEQIEYGIENHIQPDEATVRQWELVRSIGRLNENRSNEVVEPMVTALWDQGCYYNAMCPEDPNGYCGGHVPTGCAAIAMGMIMHYWGYPSQGSGTHTYTPMGYPEQSVNFGETIYDWANMPDQLTDNSTQEEIDAVSTLLWHCGVSVDTRYNSYSSSVSAELMPSALINHFNYSNELYLSYDGNISTWVTRIKHDLFHNRPILFIGISPNEGHGWVCDGIDAQDLLHYNWGWGGQDNGYYSVYAGAYGFGILGAIFNIFPDCDHGATYQIAASIDPPEYGNVYGTGLYSCGQTCSLLAEANEGYVFCNWTEDGEEISTETIYSFDIIESRNLVAHFFEASSIVISATANNEEGGVISGDGAYEYGQICTLSAEANPGFSFAYWTENGAVVSTDSDYSFSAVCNRNLKAHFYDMVCSIVFDLSLNGCCTWGGNYLVVDYGDGSSEQFTLENSLGEYYVRDVVNGNTITLSWISGELPSALCFFSVSYEDGVMIYESPMGYDHDDLHFEFEADCIGNLYEITTTVNIEDGGIVNGSGQYIYGTYCFLRAIPNPGYSFAYWTENGEVVSYDALYTTHVLSDRELVANFVTPATISLSIISDNTGTVSGEGVYLYGQECTVSALPDEGYTFLYWTSHDKVLSVDSVYTFRVVSDSSIVAHFVEEETICNIVFELFNIWGEVVTGWKDNSLVVTRDGYSEYITLKDTEKTAIHTRKFIDGSTFELTWSLGDYNYMAGSKFTISYENGFPIFQCTMPEWLYFSYNVNCSEANLPHVVNVTTHSCFGGTVMGNGTFESGEQCTVTAIPEEGFTFIKWVEDGNVVSTEPNYSFPVFADRDLIAYFAETSSLCSIDIELHWFYIWYGNALVVDYGDGSCEQFTVQEGDDASYSCNVVQTSHVSLSWISGYNPFACSFTLSYDNGNLIYQGSNPNVDFHYDFLVDCSSIPQYHFLSPGIWSEPTNWSDSTLPGTDAIVFIDAPCQLDQNASVAALMVSYDQSLTLLSGNTLTVTSTLVNMDASGLVIKDGAQLIHSSEGVYATMEKGITGYTDDGGFCLLAVPFTDSVSVPEQMTGGEYDLYLFDQYYPNAEWRNHKADAFSLVRGQGYLYANSNDTTLTLTGQIPPTDEPFSVNLTYDADAINPGYNLVGNPFTCNAYIDRAYYVLNEDGSSINPDEVSASIPIPPCTSVVVKALDENDTVVFTKATQ